MSALDQRHRLALQALLIRPFGIEAHQLHRCRVGRAGASYGHVRLRYDGFNVWAYSLIPSSIAK